MVNHGILRHVLILVLNTCFIHLLKKGIIERTIEYFKDRTESFDDYYPCKNTIYAILYDLTHVRNWLGLFVFMHNADILSIKFMTLVRLMRGEIASVNTALPSPVNSAEVPCLRINNIMMLLQERQVLEHP